PHPIALLAPGRVPPRLCTLERKAELLAQSGVDVLIAYPTDREFLSLSPDEFFQRIVCGELQALGLVEGPNFCFGKDRAGDVERLRTLCDASGRQLTVVDAVMQGDAVVSSSAIRTALREGRVSDAAAMLGRPYQLSGRVCSGAARGRAMGFPTANLAEIETLLPADGVYAGRVTFDGMERAAAVHLGPNPTFADQDRKLEVHLLDFNGDLYDHTLSVDLLARVRDTMHFANVEALRTQLHEDIANVRHLCGTPVIRET
ncbi:MAG: bifunctional riboflavin kinase/FMN adenylyltransferase, partial [Planctomycetaceae bacterium]|nr:bifunctional riboflavin kinase/FMN adenylyltransferase [Planctomycetaceae bacterium]